MKFVSGKDLQIIIISSAGINTPVGLLGLQIKTVSYPLILFFNKSISGWNKNDSMAIL